MIDHNKMNRVMAFLKENAYPYYAHANQDPDSLWQDGTYRALFHSLSEAELEQLKEMLDADSDCPRTLYYKANGVLKFRVKATMTAIDTATLLGWYTDKKSGKVGLAIKSLMLKFPKESFESQVAILKAFIMGGKKEMEWAGRKLRDRWMESLATEVDLKWKSTHNPTLGYVILRHFPDEYVLKEQDALAEVTSYAYVCARLRNVKGLHMDSKRLSTPELLYVFAKWEMEKTTAINIDVVAERFLNAYLNEVEQISSHDIGLIFWSLGKLGLTDTIIRVKPKLEKLMTYYTSSDSLPDEF